MQINSSTVTKEVKMSYELAYFPPKGTRWTWSSKSLNYSPWVCQLSSQKEPKLFLHPLNIVLIVDKVDDNYTWYVEICDFMFKRVVFKGTQKTPLKACRAAERIGERALKKLLPSWARTALQHKWRTPAI